MRGTSRPVKRVESASSLVVMFYGYVDGERQYEDFGMELVYKPDRNQLPALETVLRFPVARR